MKRKFTKHPSMIKASTSTSLVDEFLEYHEDENNFHSNKAGFDAMYDILNKYGDTDEDVDVVFNRATLEDQSKMVDLIRPKSTEYDPDISAILEHLENLVDKGILGEASCKKIADMLP